MNVKKIWLALLLISATAIPAVFGQGSLTPPGAPTPTMKTLDQVEARTPLSSIPFVISSPGSYYLTTNLTGTSGQSGFTIAADNVTLDLNGFTLTGSGSQSGILVSGARRNLTVMNGTLQNWTQRGVFATNATGSTFARLRLLNNPAHGMWVGRNNVVKECVATANTVGIETGPGCVVTDCNIFQNNGCGLRVAVGSRVAQCNTVSNLFYGIITTGHAQVSQCVVQGNDVGGVSIDSGEVSDCLVSRNLGNGVEVYIQGEVRQCTVIGNTNHGVFANNTAAVLNNTLQANGTVGSPNSAGIIAGNSVRIEGNTLIANQPYGIKLTGGYNAVLKNVATSSLTNYDFGTNLNTLGAIVGFTAVATNTQPNSNIIY